MKRFTEKVLTSLLLIWASTWQETASATTKPAVKLPNKRSSAVYFDALNALAKGSTSEKEAQKIELLMNMAGITVTDRKVVIKALERAKETDGPAAALELRDGRIITGKQPIFSEQARRFC